MATHIVSTVSVILFNFQGTVLISATGDTKVQNSENTKFSKPPGSCGQLAFPLEFCSFLGMEQHEVSACRTTASC